MKSQNMINIEVWVIKSQHFEAKKNKQCDKTCQNSFSSTGFGDILYESWPFPPADLFVRGGGMVVQKKVMAFFAQAD